MKNDIYQIIKEAGNLLLKQKGHPNKVSLKNDNYDLASLVSQADISSEKLIINKLEKLFPQDNIFSEETGLINKNSNKTWYIDPLDGTSNYLRNIPLWGISVGLVESGKPILGVIYIPELEQLYYAENTKGAFLNDQKIHVSSRQIDKALFFGRSYYNKKLNLNTKIGELVGLTKIVDASSYELSQIAAGNAEVYSLVNVPHDVVAGIVLVTEAGGKVTDFEGNDWNPNSKEIIATNGIVHDQILKSQS